MNYCDFDRWEFVNDEVLHWTWRRFAADGHLRMPSRVTFQTLDDCVADARLYGFVDDEDTNDPGIELCLDEEPTAHDARTATRPCHVRR